MSGMRKRLRGFLDAIDGLPVQVIKCEPTGSCHYKIYITYQGQNRFFVCSGSPSDRRTLKNFKSEVTNWIRQHNAEGGSNAA